MTKPASLPRWADVGADIVEPSSGFKDTGNIDGDLPRHDYFNWWQNLVYQWTSYLNDGYLEGTFGLKSDITPSAITGTVSNYAPTGLSTASVIRQDLSGTTSLTGLTGGVDGRIIVLINIDPALALTLVHDATSTAANRFYCPNASSIRLQGEGACAVLLYDATVSRWRVVAHCAGRQRCDIQVGPAGGFNFSGTWSANSFYITPTAVGAIRHYPLNLEHGMVLTGFNAAVRSDNVNDITVRIVKTDTSGATPIFEDTSTTGSGSNDVLLLDSGTEVIDGDSLAGYYVEVEGSASDTDLRFYNVTITAYRQDSKP